jgi:hypothetical protein
MCSWIHEEVRHHILAKILIQNSNLNLDFEQKNVHLFFIFDHSHINLLVNCLCFAT